MSFKRVLRKLGPGRKGPHLGDLATFARDAGEVITRRTAQGITGKLGAGEAHRMVAEKQSAAVKAYFAFTAHALRGKFGSASAASFNVF